MQAHFINKQGQFELHLDELAEMVVHKQGIQFASFQEAQCHLADIREKIKQLLWESNAMFVEGLTYLRDGDFKTVSDIAGKIHAQLHSPSDVADIIEVEITKNNQALNQFSEAVNSFYGCGDFHVEECVVAVLLTLFPMEPLPFACYATMIWRKDGIEEAVSFYRKIVDMFESPVLDYFAADCYFKSDNKIEAKRILDRAMDNVAKEPGAYDDVGQFIRILLRQF